MTILVVSIAVALLVLAVLLFAALRQGAPINSVDELLAGIQPVDIEAFRNLTDPAEEVFLRNNLEPAEFRRIQRQRMLAAAEYVRRTAHNASILLRAGQAARSDRNSEIADAAEQLVDRAVRLRACSLGACALLYARAAVPGLHITVSDVTRRYVSVRETLLHLSRLQAPAEVPRIEAAL